MLLMVKVGSLMVQMGLKINWFYITIALLYIGAMMVELSKRQYKMAVIYSCYGLATGILSVMGDK